MKKFRIKLVKFCIPIISLLIITIIFFFYTKFKTKKRILEISKNECFIMGDSQVQRINPHLIGHKTYNFASSGEHFYFSYFKLLDIIEAGGGKPKMVILGVSIHNFSPIYDRLFDLNYAEGKNSLKRYLYFTRVFENYDFISSYKQLLNYETFLNVYNGQDWGGFYESNNSNPSIDLINKTFKMHFSKSKIEEKYSQTQVNYLNKIDSLCMANNIELVLLSTPYHLKYKNQIDTGYFDFFTHEIEKIKHRKHLNFLNDSIDSSYMSDANHLNVKGATFYSNQIQNQLRLSIH